MIVKGEKIRAFREERGYTLTDMARKANLSFSYLSEIERGVKQPSLKTVDKIAKALNVPKEHLIELDEENNGISMGEKIRMVREQKGWSLADLAERTGISLTYLSEIERDKVFPSVSTIQKIALQLEIPVVSLLDQDNSIGFKLRSIREEHGLTQAELAQFAGVSPGLIGQIEHGKVRPSFKTIQKIAEAIGISPCFFVLDNEGIVSMVNSFSVELREMLVNPNVQAVLRIISNLNENELKFILNFIQLFKKVELTDFR